MRKLKMFEHISLDGVIQVPRNRLEPIEMLSGAVCRGCREMATERNCSPAAHKGEFD